MESGVLYVQLRNSYKPSKEVLSFNHINLFVNPKFFESAIYTYEGEFEI